MVNIKLNLKNKIKGKNNVSSNFNIEQSYIFKCEKDDIGSRLDLFLFSKIKNNTNIDIFSRNRIQTLLDEGNVTLNDKLIFFNNSLSLQARL